MMRNCGRHGKGTEPESRLRIYTSLADAVPFVLRVLS